MIDNTSPFNLEQYDYPLPQGLIAQKPAEPRDSSRLMIVDRKSGKFEHRVFKDLPEFVDSNDLLVVNRTRVIRARLLGKRLLPDGALGGKVEFLMLEQHGPKTWEGAFHASAKHRAGVKFRVPLRDGTEIEGTLVRGASDSPSGTVVAEFDRDPVEAGAGAIPLPPYIERAADTGDDTTYQTVYATEAGSAAAPTAGLHFTDDVISKVRARGAQWETVTLHVGLGTFRPVKAPDIREHVMHEERYAIEPTVAQHLTEWKRAGKRILAVGTTSVRTLESAWDGEKFVSGNGRTGIFIHPGGKSVQVVDRLLTNFHLPKSTLFMMICAFASTELMQAAYAEAIREKYRFFSYGDAMLIK